MLVEQLLDLAGEVLLATAVDDLLLASSDAHIAFLVRILAEVAGAEPAVRREAVAIRGGVVEVAHVHRGADRRDLAHLAEGHVIAVVVDHAQAHRVHAATHGAVHLERVVSETGKGVETCFEHAVELDQLGARDGGLEGFDRLDRSRCAAGYDDAQRAQVAPRQLGRVQHRDD